MYDLEKTREDGWFVYYKDGWKSGYEPSGAVHYDCEPTKREIMKAIKNAEKCCCKDCVKKWITTQLSQ